jgi:hypothetical protein
MLVGVNDQFFFREELKRAIALDIDGIAKVAIRGWKHRNDDAVLMVVSRFFNSLADCKFGHRELLSGIVDAIIRTNWLTDLKQMGRCLFQRQRADLKLRHVRP